MNTTQDGGTSELKDKVYALLQVWHAQSYLHYQLAISQNYAAELMRDVIHLCIKHDLKHGESIIASNLFTDTTLRRAMYSTADSLPDTVWPLRREDLEAFTRSYSATIDPGDRAPLFTSTPKKTPPVWAKREEPMDEQYLTALEALELQDKAPPIPQAPKKTKRAPGRPKFVDLTQPEGATAHPETAADAIFGKVRSPVFNENQKEQGLKKANALIPQEIRGFIEATLEGVKLKPGHPMKIARKLDNQAMGMAVTAYASIKRRLDQLYPSAPTSYYLFPVQQELPFWRNSTAILLGATLFGQLYRLEQQEITGTQAPTWPPAYLIGAMFGLNDDDHIKEIYKRGMPRR